ncbi:MAG: sirC [Gemmataceae bacterium]|nr:sirC [Gemmataceae bacterium]
MFPVMLDLTGRVVVVVGGGPVGRRKARAAGAAGAVVRVVDPRPAEGLPGVVWVVDPYTPDHLAGAALVFACASPEVNARVVADAKTRGVWVNSASDPDQGDCFLPAVVRQGGLTLAVSTGGASPALARRVREQLGAGFDAAFAGWVQLLNEIRPEVLAAVADPEKRRALLDALADWPWLDRLRAEGPDAVRAAMREEVRRAAIS